MKTLPSRIAIDHPLTHHGGNPDPIEKVTRINTCHAAQVAAFLDKLKGAGEADGTLLDRMGVRPESIGDSTAPTSTSRTCRGPESADWRRDRLVEGLGKGVERPCVLSDSLGRRGCQGRWNRR